MSKFQPRQYPRQAGLWVPVLVLPLVLGEIWLHMTGHRPSLGTAFSLAATMAILAWYLLAGGIVIAYVRSALARRYQLASVRTKIKATKAAMWAVDTRGTILQQSFTAVDAWGDFINCKAKHLFGGQLANADQDIARLCAVSFRHGKSQLTFPDGRVLQAERIGDEVLLLFFADDFSDSESNISPVDYDNLPIAVLRLSADGMILHANPATASYCGNGIVGQHLSTVLDGLGRSFDDWLADSLNSRGPVATEVLRAVNMGYDRFIQVSLYTESKRAGTLIAVLSDARAVKSLEAQFVQSQKMQAIGQLAGGIAHDFNNLLMAISGHCDLLLLRHDKGDPDFVDLDQISQNVNRAANLVSHLLAFSRKQTLKQQKLDLRDTIGDLSHLLSRLVGKNVNLVLKHDQGLEAVNADRGKIEQVLMNLVVNARDAMPKGGKIEITTTNAELSDSQYQARFAVPPGRYVVVTVADEGCGIAPDVRSKIFEPFFTTKRPGEGTGLGLSSAYGIVKQTGGYILCDSTLGEGTVFTIYLPVYIGDDPVVTEESLSVPPNRRFLSAPSQRILLVEDEDSIRAFTSRVLKMHGYQVIEAASGEKALDLLKDGELEIDIFISDVVMPGLDGPSWVCQALKDRPETCVIFMSGYAEDIFEGNRDSTKGAAFLQKPFSLTALIDCVENARSFT